MNTIGRIGSAAAMRAEPAIEPPSHDEDALTADEALEQATDEFERDGFALAQGLACLVEDGEKLAGFATSLRLEDVDVDAMSAGQLLAIILAPVDNLLRGICACELRERLVKAAKAEIKARAGELMAEVA